MGAAPLLVSTVEDEEAELPEAELEGVVTEVVLFERTPEELGVVVANEVVVAVTDSDGVDVVFVVLDELDAGIVPTV